MKYTTAKTVLKIYRREGRFGKKKQRLKKGYAKLASSSLSGLPQEKLASLVCSTTSNVCAHPDSPKDEEISTPPVTAFETTLCASFWGSKIAEHFK